MLRRITETMFLGLIAAASLPLLILRSLLAARRSAPQLPQLHPDPFAFHQALPAYEALIDSTAARRP